jgi:glycosyltransferase involved in cell wall biosynthesis
MREVINQIPDAELLIASLFYPVELQNLAKQLQIENNVKFLGYQRDMEKVYSNVSVLLVSSLSESFPMVTNEGKYFGLPIVAFDLEYCPPFKKGVITVNMFDYKAMANEIVKLLSDYEYRREKGLEAKQSLDMFNNTETIKIWDDLFKSLLDGNSAFQKLRQKSRDKYYDKNNAEISIKKHYLYAQEFNIYMKCHKFEDFMNLDYMKDLTTCPIE